MDKKANQGTVLPWSKEVARGDQFGIARVKQPSDDPNVLKHMHRHQGFVELAWIEQGEGLHLVNGRKIPLKASDLLMVREKDLHSFKALSPQIIFVNLTFSTALMESLRRRYFQKNPSFFPLQAPLPYHRPLTPFLRQWLDENAPSLALGPRKLFDIEAFLLPFFHHLYAPSGQVKLESCPDWLQAAYDAIRKPAHCVLGIREFERLCGRSQEHVARVTRKWLGTTPLAIVNRARLDLAAGKISQTSLKISDIAMDAGFNNLASFYRLFQKAYKVPPRRYRLQKQISFG